MKTKVSEQLSLKNSLLGTHQAGSFDLLFVMEFAEFEDRFQVSDRFREFTTSRSISFGKSIGLREFHYLSILFLEVLFSMISQVQTS